MPLRQKELHRTGRMGGLRAAALGANEGIVSTASLVLGVAAADGTRSSGVAAAVGTRSNGLVAGVAGLVAGVAGEDAAIIYVPVGALVPLALRAVQKGGRVVCAGIQMSDIPSFPYSILSEERQLLPVANLTRSDGVELFKIVAQAGIKTHTTVFPLREANEVLSKLRFGQIPGASVMRP